ncbi:MAG: glutathione S-transferase family protein [Acidiferrobacterales bacterium]|nr:glutathione S-transferase family protein [Acidiferrobacterales bacterium]
MLTLYDYLPSQNAYKVRVLLNHLDRPYKQKMISIFEGEGRAASFQKVSPTGTVPAIKTESGVTIAESNAILVYLATDTQYLSSDPLTRAKTMQWLFFEGETVQGGIATLRHWIQTGKDKNRTPDILQSKRQLSMKALQILNNELDQNSFLGGNQYSIADISNFAYVHLAEEANLPLSSFPAVERWIDRVKQQDRFLAQTYPYSRDPFSHREL